LVQKSFSLLTYLYRHHFVRYLFVGGSTFVIDFSLLFILHSKAGLSLAVATSVGYWTSIIYNFFLNRSWTFSASEKRSLHKHLLMYGLLLCCNYAFTLLFISIFSHFINYLLAKAIAVAIQMSWTYLVYKNVVFAVTKDPLPANPR